MGRRNINTTKSGKYMNPTDQARKEARKKELKKNKRQRMAVRAAVLKGKDPTQLIVEMEKMDQMEYNVEIPPSLSEKVLKDKRKKLRETLDRVLKLYEKENPEYWVEIRRMVADYEKKRLALIEYYDAVKQAQAVTLDEIPLPNLDMPPLPEDGHFDGIEMALPQQGAGELGMEGVLGSLPQPHGILKRPHPLYMHMPTNLLPSQLSAHIRMPPGCPPLLPPDLSDDEDMEQPMETDAPKQRKIRFEDDSENRSIHSNEGKDRIDKEDSDREERNEDSDDSYHGDGKNDRENDRQSQKSQGLTSLQAKLLRLSGQDVDQFVRETEVLLQEREADKRADLRERLSRLKDKDRSSSKKSSSRPPPPSVDVLASSAAPDTVSSMTQATPDTVIAPPGDSPVVVLPSSVPGPYSVIPPVGVPPVGVPPVPAPSSLPMFRPPPRPGMPPPPIGVRLPPGPPPQNLSQLLPQSLPRLPNMRLPPPMRPLGVLPRAPLPGVLPPSAPGLLSAAPNVLSAAPQLLPRPARHASSAPTATIQAKPQIRSLSADVTRFLPTALRVKREDKKKQTKTTTDGKEVTGRLEEPDKKPTKDDAYSQFMREMEDLL